MFRKLILNHSNISHKLPRILLPQFPFTFSLIPYRLSLAVSSLPQIAEIIVYLLITLVSVYSH